MENPRKHRDIRIVTTDKQMYSCIRTELSFKQIHFKKLVDNGNEKDRSKNE